MSLITWYYLLYVAFNAMLSSKFQPLGGFYCILKIDNIIGFTDFVLESSKKYASCIKNMEKLDNSIDWSKI